MLFSRTSIKIFQLPAPLLFELKLVLDPPDPKVAIVPNCPPRCWLKLVFEFWNPPCEPPAFRNGTPKPPNCPLIEVNSIEMKTTKHVNLCENMICKLVGDVVSGQSINAQWIISLKNYYRFLKNVNVWISKTIAKLKNWSNATFQMEWVQISFK